MGGKSNVAEPNTVGAPEIFPKSIKFGVFFYIFKMCEV